MNLSRMYWRHHKNRAVMLLMTIVVSTMAMTMGTFMARSQSQTAVQEKLDETGEYDLVVPDISEKDLQFVQRFPKVEKVESILNGGSCRTGENDEVSFGTLNGKDAQKLFHYEPEQGGRYPELSGEIAGYKSTFQQMGVAAVVGNKLELELTDTAGHSQGKREFRIVGVLNDQRKRAENVQRMIDPVAAGWEDDQKFSDIPKLFVSRKDLPEGYTMTGMIRCRQDCSVYDVEKKLKQRKMLVAESNRLNELGSLVSVNNEKMIQKELYQKAHLSYGDFYSAYAVPCFYLVIFIVSFCAIYGIAADVLMERQHQMGLLRSIGMSGRRVKKMLVREFGIFCLSGVAGGYLLGTGGYILLLHLINRYSSVRIYSAFHAHIIAKAVSVDPYVYPWLFGGLFCLIPVVVVLLRQRGYFPLELLYPEKNKKRNMSFRFGRRIRNPINKLLSKIIGESVGIAVILILTTWSLVFGCLFTMAKSKEDNIFAVEDLGKAASVDADYYAVKDMQSTNIANVQYNRHNEGITQKDYTTLKNMKAVGSGIALTKMPGIKVLYRKKDMPAQLQEALQPLNIMNNMDEDLIDLYEKSDRTIGYLEGEILYQAPAVAVSDTMLSGKSIEVVSGKIDPEALNQGTQILVSEDQGDTQNPYKSGDKVTLTDEVITDQRTEEYDFSQNVMPKWEKPNFTYYLKNDSSKKRYPGYAFGKRKDQQVTVGAVVRIKDSTLRTELYAKSSVWNDRNTKTISPGFNLICTENAVKKWGYPDQTYTDVYFKLKANAAGKDVDAFEVAWYQIVGKSGKSMDGVSRHDVLQRIRRGEQTNLSIFAIMICLVVVTGMFGLINGYLFAARRNESEFQLLRAIGISRRRLFGACMKKKLMLPVVAVITSMLPVIIFDKIRLYAKHYAFDLDHNSYATLKNGKNVICWQARFPWYIELFGQPVVLVAVIALLLMIGMNLLVGYVQLKELKKQSIVEGIRNDEF